MLQIPPREVVSYLSRFGVAAIYIVGAGTGLPPVAIGAATDLGRALSMVRNPWPDLRP